MVTVRIGGLTFEEFPRDLSNAFVIEPDGLVGWEGGTDVRREDTPRPSGHGSFDAPGWLSARVVSIAGVIIADTPGGLRHRVAALTGLLAPGGASPMTVDSDVTSWADVRLAGKTQVAVFGGTETEADYQVSFWAPDMRKYGERGRFTGSSVQVSHYGNFAASPVITVSGSAPSGYTVTGPGGRQFVVTRALVAGQPHTIDMSTGWLSVAGVVVTGGVGRADTWSVPPGVRTVMSVSGGLTLTVDVLDTFI